MKTIQTVKEYNSKFMPYNFGMMFLTKNGTPLQRGFVVTINGASKLYKTLKEAEQSTEQDFQKEATLPCYSHGGSMTLISEINN